MIVEWNKRQEGFENRWIWQFGEGPFKVLDTYSVPTEPSYLGKTEITFEPGYWLLISTPNMAYQYRVEYGLKHTMFHKKWLLPVKETLSDSITRGEIYA